MNIGKFVDKEGVAEIDLPSLINSRLLVQANSGGGKSYVIRKILEKSHGQVQQIVLDIEGDFASLREKYDYVLVGKDGADIQVSTKIADMLARRLLELNVSAIIDLYELKQRERILFVKRFLESMINAPKKLWHPCLVVVDEAHIVCPEKGKAESKDAVIDLCTLGRKRGFGSLLATQRISKLNKDAAAELNNKLIGRTGLDVDMKRAGDELGFSSREDVLSLRNLNPGDFFGFGPAISNAVEKLSIDPVETTHPEAGKRQLKSPPPATKKVKGLLAQLEDLPQEAEEEARTVEDLQAQVRDLQRELRKKPQQAPTVDVKALERAHRNEISQRDTLIKELTQAVEKVANIANGALGKELPRIPERTRPQPTTAKQPPVLPRVAPDRSGHGLVSGGALRMLKAAAMFYPEVITKMRMAALAGLSYKSGTFGTYLSALKKDGLIIEEGAGYVATEEGLGKAGDVGGLPDDLVSMWEGIVKGGSARMLRAVADAYPDTLSREEVGELAELSHRSGTFGTYLSTLKRNGLVNVSSAGIRLSDDLV